MKCRNHGSLIGIVVFCMLLTVVFMPPRLEVEAATPSLAGESFFSPAPILLSETCQSPTDGKFSFSANGTAAGPFPGTFDESGTISISAGQIIFFESSFKIHSPGHTIFGTKRLISGTGTCAGDKSAVVQLTYEATIDGFRDSGISDAQIFFSRDGSTAFFTERFLSNQPQPAAVILDPLADTNEVGTTHTVIATVLDGKGQPVSGVTVLFTVSGSVDTLGKCKTDVKGRCSFTYQGPELPGADLITGCADTDNSGRIDRGEPCGAATKAWITPASTPGNVTGGGQIIHNFTIHGVAFGFNAQSSENGLKGQGVVIDKTSATKIKLLDVSALVIDPTGTHATFFGNGTINGMPTTYRVDVDDFGEPAVLDTFKIQTESGFVAGGTLMQGNIQIHR